jgi:hypothetical protein
MNPRTSPSRSVLDRSALTALPIPPLLLESCRNSSQTPPFRARNSLNGNKGIPEP